MQILLKHDISRLTMQLFCVCVLAYARPQFII